jgi:hypothetical protein
VTKPSVSTVVWMIVVFLAWPLLAGAAELGLISALIIAPATPLLGAGVDGPLYSDVVSNAVPFFLVAAPFLVALVCVWVCVRFLGAPRMVWIAVAASGLINVVLAAIALGALVVGQPHNLLSTFLTYGPRADPLPLLRQLPYFLLNDLGPALASALGAWLGALAAVRQLRSKATGSAPADDAGLQSSAVEQAHRADAVS